MPKVSETFKEFNLTPTQFGVMDMLNAKGRMKISELIDCMLATSGNMTVVIKNMEKKGWLIRKACQTDKRAFEIDLTDAGRRIIQAAIPHISEQWMRLFPFCLLTNSPNW